jgi:hypothetical protein
MQAAHVALLATFVGATSIFTAETGFILNAPKHFYQHLAVCCACGVLGFGCACGIMIVAALEDDMSCVVDAPAYGPVAHADDRPPAGPE